MQTSNSGQPLFQAELFVEATIELDRSLAEYRASLDRGAPPAELQSKLRAVFQFAAESIFLLDELGDDCVTGERIAEIKSKASCARCAAAA